MTFAIVSVYSCPLVVWNPVRAVAMEGRADTQEELERVAEIVAVIPIESVRAIIDCELGA
jgi:hypothetical protein